MYTLCLLTDPSLHNDIVHWKDLSSKSVIKDYGRFFIRRYVIICSNFIHHANQDTWSRSWLRSLKDGCLLDKYQEMVRSHSSIFLSCFLIIWDLVSAMKKRLEKEAMEQEE